jgi:hypothetical protein
LFIDTVQLEHPLRNIDADHCNGRMRRLQPIDFAGSPALIWR